MTTPIYTPFEGTVVVETPPPPPVAVVEQPPLPHIVDGSPLTEIAVPVPGPPGKDASVVIEGQFNHTHVQTELDNIWTIPNTLGRQITTCRVIYPTTPEGENVYTNWYTSADNQFVYVDHKHPATGKAIIS